MWSQAELADAKNFYHSGQRCHRLLARPWRVVQVARGFVGHMVESRLRPYGSHSGYGLAVVGDDVFCA